MDNLTMVTVSKALTLAQDFCRRYPEGRATPEEAKQIMDLSAEALGMLAQPEKATARAGFLWEPS